MENNSNPYYLHEQKQLNVYNRQQGKYQQLNVPSTNTNINDQFASENSSKKTQINTFPLIAPYQPIIYQPPQVSYQPLYQQVSYPPVSYPQYPSSQIPQYGVYQPSPSYPPQPAPLFREYQQSSSRNSHKTANMDHCPFCNQITYSVVDEKLTCLAWIVCMILFIVTVFLFWIPCCFSSCKERHVKCVNCHRTKFVIKNDC